MENTTEKKLLQKKTKPTNVIDNFSIKKQKGIDSFVKKEIIEKDVADNNTTTKNKSNIDELSKNRITRDFYMTGCVDLASKLIGKIICRKVDDEWLKCRIVETEAYVGPDDKAAHCYQNKKTERTKYFWQKGGHLYVYVIYSTNNCFNIVAGEPDKPEAVLIRAVEPIEGIKKIKELRNAKSNKDTIPQLANLGNGPGKAGAALNINKTDNAVDLVTSSEIFLIDDPDYKFEVERSVRINIDYAEEYQYKPWRFFIKNHAYVSKVKPKFPYKE